MQSLDTLEESKRLAKEDKHVRKRERAKLEEKETKKGDKEIQS